MKSNLHHKIICTVTFGFFVALLPGNVHAQEAELTAPDYKGASVVETEDIEYDISSSYAMENERSGARFMAVNYVTTDSIIAKTSANTTASRHQQKTKSVTDSQKNSTESQKEAGRTKTEKDNNESVLSFNFLYYIFEKYKMSDIVDR